MSEKKPVDQQIVDFLKKKGTATVDEVAAAVKIGRTSARKYLSGLTVDKKVLRAPGGRAGRRKLPDNFSLPEKTRGGNPKKAASRGSKNSRLGPGGLDKLVLDHMRRHKGDAPQTASAIGKAIERSSGAVANCLTRLEKQSKVRLAKPKPRSYELAGAKEK